MLAGGTVRVTVLWEPASPGGSICPGQDGHRVLQ